jgi:biopolymer transport protein ExbD
MAGGGAPTPTRGGRRTVEFNVNLVPAIDLLSVLISFLLITAVWTQTARVDVKQALPKTGGAAASDGPPPLQVLVTEQQMRLRFGEREVALDGPDVRERLVAELAALHLADPEKQPVRIGATDRVDYGRVVQVIDVMLDHHLTQLSVGGVESLEGMSHPG